MSRLKECFTSRFLNGRLVVADYSQLEVVCLAIASKDERLADDLRGGVDMHSARAEELWGAPVSRTERQKAKELSFQLQYGAGPKSMANRLKISEDLARKFIENYYNRYPKVKQYQDNLMQQVISGAEYQGVRKNGTPLQSSYYVSPTGRHYYFQESVTEWGTNFSPTEVKNYPIQGLAGGDIMSLAVASVYNAILRGGYHDEILLVNTVHDNLVADVQDMRVQTALRIFSKCLNEVDKLIQEQYKVDTMGIPLRVDISTGPSLADLTPAITSVKL